MRFLTFPATKQASWQMAACGTLGHREETALKKSHLPASPASSNSCIENQGMNNMHHLPWALATEVPPGRYKSTTGINTANTRGPSAMRPQGPCQQPALQQGQTEIKRGGIGGNEYVMTSTDPNSLSALCPIPSTRPHTQS